jgi:signal transduction histidine kinase/DNA-binding NarL/FixJ family response regulator
VVDWARFLTLFRPTTLIWAAIACSITYFGGDLWRTRKVAEDQAQSLITSYVRLVAEHAVSTFDRTSMVLDHAREVVTPADLAAARAMTEDRRAAIQQQLLKWQQGASGVVSISITDADGIVFANTVGRPPGGSLADREYFLALKSDPSDRAVVSQAVMGRISNKWGIQVARRLTLPDGRFGGMIVANIGLSDHFEKFYSTLSFSKQAVIILRYDDDTFISRFPLREDLIGRKSPPILPSQIITSTGDEIIYRRQSSFDDIPRLFALRRLRGYPIAAVVGIGEDDYLYGWRRSLTGAVIALFVIFTGALLLQVAINRKRETDKALKAKEDQLRTEEARRQTAEISQMEEQAKAAQSASQAKTELLAIVSHEIRTPLHGVIGMSELLGQTPLSAQQESFVATIRQCSESLVALVNDILDYAKIDAGHLDLDIGDFDLAALVEGTTAIVRRQCTEKQLALSVSVAATLPRFVEGDAVRLRQVLVNLLTNAVKFTETGTILLQVEPEEEPDWVRFSVTDSGVGISPDVIPNLFKPFSQADLSISRRFGGTGLGLAICKRIVAAMAGDIGVTSTEGAGSTFWFSVALPEGRNVAMPEATVEFIRPLSVLLADDNAVNRRVATAMLESDGHTVTIAEDGVIALERLEDGRFDVVLMDIHMPRMDGIEATRRIRANPATAHLPVIALTADALSEDARRWREVGMTGFIAKPFTIQKLRLSLADAAEGVSESCGEDFDDEAFIALQSVLSPTELRELAATFSETAAELIDTARRAWQEDRHQDASEQLHQLAGMAGYLGLASLASDMRRAMALIRGGDMEGAADTVTSLPDRLRHAEEVLHGKLTAT